MAVYNENQMNRMRQDAIRRSQEMHRKAAGSLPSYRDEPNAGNARYIGFNENSGRLKPGKGGFSSFIDDILGGGIDDDKLLIAALLYMLIKEGADIKLIIALGYILL